MKGPELRGRGRSGRGAISRPHGSGRACRSATEIITGRTCIPPRQISTSHGMSHSSPVCFQQWTSGTGSPGTERRCEPPESRHPCSSSRTGPFCGQPSGYLPCHCEDHGCGGNTVPTAGNQVNLEVVGEGRLIGFDNGKPCDLFCIHPFHGMAQAMQPARALRVDETLWEGKRCRFQVR